VRAWQVAYDGTIDSTLLEGIGNGLNVIEKISSAKPEFSRAGAVSTSLKTLRNFGRFLLRSEVSGF